MKNIKYIALSLFAFSLLACDNDELDDLRERNNPNEDPLPELASGSADFSNFVTIGTSYTAGFTDNALFIAAQENSYPNIMAQQFAKIGGGEFTQPLMNDNFGGLAIAGNRIANPRLVFDGSGPTGIESIVGPITVSTDITQNPTGPFNNLGIPGLQSFHLVLPGYGNLANFPDTANPYAVRVTGNTPDATLVELALAQNPTFFILGEIGGNDTLGFATSGGDGSRPLTPTSVFDASLNAAVTALRQSGANGAIGTINSTSSLPFFTTVPHDPLDPSNPAFGPLIPTLNSIYGALNGVFAFLQSQGLTDAAGRNVAFAADAASPVVIVDESLTDLSAEITGVLLQNPTFPDFLAQFGIPAVAAPTVAGLLGQTYGQARQATPNDLLLLTSSSIIGTVNTTVAGALAQQGLSPTVAGQFAVEGVTLPLADRWVLIPSEQEEINVATDAYNATIRTVASTNDLALVDFNAIFIEASTTGYEIDDFILTADLVTGGLVSLDGIHLTARGYALMARSYLEAIDVQFGSNFVASGNIPNAGDFPTNYSPALQ